MKLIPFKELVKLTSEKLDEALAPIRARAAEAKATLEIAKIEEKLVNLEREVQTLCAAKELDFDTIIRKLDEHSLAERKAKQIKQLVKELFP